MKLDLSKLKNVQHKADGKATAQCPACAAEGGDAKGDHLVIFRDGKFGCVVNEKDKAHNRKILELAGSKDRGDGANRLTVKPLLVEDSKVLMKVGRLGRPKATPWQEGDCTSPRGEAPNRNAPDETRPQRPAPDDAQDDSLSWSDAEFMDNFEKGILSKDLREFLDLPVN